MTIKNKINMHMYFIIFILIYYKVLEFIIGNEIWQYQCQRWIQRECSPLTELHSSLQTNQFYFVMFERGQSVYAGIFITL